VVPPQSSGSTSRSVCVSTNPRPNGSTNAAWRSPYSQSLGLFVRIGPGSAGGVEHSLHVIDPEHQLVSPGYACVTLSVLAHDDPGALGFDAELRAMSLPDPDAFDKPEDIEIPGDRGAHVDDSKHRNDARPGGPGRPAWRWRSSSSRPRSPGWRAVNAPHMVALVRVGATFHRGKLVNDPSVAPPNRRRSWSPKRSSSTGIDYFSGASVSGLSQFSWLR